MAGVKIVTFLLCFAAGCLARSARSNDPLVQAFESLPDAEKNDFLAYYLAQGVLDTQGNQTERDRIIFRRGSLNNVIVIPDSLHLNEELVKKFQAMNIPKNSVRKLMMWTQNTFHFTVDDIKMLLVKKKVCYDGICYTYPDIGSTCCPW